MILFEIHHRDSKTAARRGTLTLSRGEVETPVFMPVGTAGTVKAMPHEFLELLGARLILGNTYHLYLRPGMEIIRRFGGLHSFISWDWPILTDSGGYQVFSHRELNQISEEGVEFKSHLDGSRHFFSPESSIEIQKTLGSDIIMAFDDCTPYPVSRKEAEDSMHRSMRWAERCQKALGEEDHALFGIVQGSVFRDLRRESLQRIEELDFPGVAMGGFSVGEPKLLMHELLEELSSEMPEAKPHYLMGVGTPLDLIYSVRSGYDMFDCVLPTRNARNGTLFTWEGIVRIKNAVHKEDDRPIDEDCECLVCQRYSRAYLRHLYVSGEILSSVLNTYHNLYFYLELMETIRESISNGELDRLTTRIEEAYA